jgi:hypothetical protein
VDPQRPHPAIRAKDFSVFEKNRLKPICYILIRIPEAWCASKRDEKTLNFLSCQVTSCKVKLVLIPDIRSLKRHAGGLIMVQYPISHAFLFKSCCADLMRKGQIMFKAIMLAMTVGLIVAMESGPPAMASTPDLSQYTWKNRLLLLFAPDRSHPYFESLQQALMERRADAMVRDLVVFEILASGTSRVDGADIDSNTSRSLQERFQISPSDFSVILIGKDGGIKLKRGEQTNLEDIFGLIDSMPMRQEEIRDKSRNP